MQFSTVLAWKSTTNCYKIWEQTRRVNCPCKYTRTNDNSINNTPRFWSKVGYVEDFKQNKRLKWLELHVNNGYNNVEEVSTLYFDKQKKQQKRKVQN